MKKSKKLAWLKRVSVCGGCKYAEFESIDLYDGDSMICSRHHSSPVCFSDSPCSHYVPFNDVMCPRKTPYYWLDGDFMPF